MSGQVTVRWWCAAWALSVALPVTRVTAQEFQPPRSGAESGTRFGLFGFGVRTGVDLTAPRQLVIGLELDVGSLFTERLRLRPSGEVGVDGDDSYVVSLEGLYRFAGDDEPTVPYVGLGFSIAGHDRCGLDSDCPDVWANVVIAFERRFRSTFNWLIEYHGMDLLRRHRLYVGLATRRGG
jgi:hypothetical protein